MKYKKYILQQTEVIKRFLRERSQREQILIFGATAGISLIFFVSFIYTPIEQAFDLQARVLAKSEKDYELSGILLERYRKLALRKAQVEDQYKKVEIKEGLRSYVENLLQNKAKISSGVQIRQVGLPRKLGDEFEQVTVSAPFQTSSLSNLTNFLTEVVKGQSPLLLTKLNIDKRKVPNQLSVTVDISSIRRIEAQ